MPGLVLVGSFTVLGIYLLLMSELESGFRLGLGTVLLLFLSSG